LAKRKRAKWASKKKPGKKKEPLALSNGEGEVIAFATGATTIRAGGAAFLPESCGGSTGRRSSRSWRVQTRERTTLRRLHGAEPFKAALVMFGVPQSKISVRYLMRWKVRATQKISISTDGSALRRQAKAKPGKTKFAVMQRREVNSRY